MPSYGTNIYMSWHIRFMPRCPERRRHCLLLNAWNILSLTSWITAADRWIKRFTRQVRYFFSSSLITRRTSKTSGKPWSETSSWLSFRKKLSQVSFRKVSAMTHDANNLVLIEYAITITVDFMYRLLVNIRPWLRNIDVLVFRTKWYSRNVRRRAFQFTYLIQFWFSPRQTCRCFRW